jgi:predicted nucleic acid-binding Zn ribbon protein
MKQKQPNGECVVCGAPLGGKQATFCSNVCKQREKYARARGRSCKHCHKPIDKPVRVMGGFKQDCDRKRCVASRTK